MPQILAKLTAPQIQNVHVRTRLFDKIDAARQQGKAIWVSAPAGSGKTTVIANYAEHHQFPMLWYQIDAGDTDISLFFDYLARAAESFTDDAKPLPRLTPEYMLALPVFTRNFFRQLFSQLPANTMIVFDNYQDVPDGAPLYQLLALALDEIPSNIHIVFVSRVDPHPVYARAQAHGVLQVIDKETVWLDKQEAEAIASIYGNDSISDELLDAMLDKTHGWTTGLILFCEQSQEQLLENLSEASDDQSLVFNYFAGVLFQELTDELQTLLMDTAFFPKYNLQQANEILGDKIDCQLAVSELLKRNIFTTRHRGEQVSYEYHPLFREFLQEQAISVLGQEASQHLINKTAESLSASQQWEAAAALFARAENWPALAMLIVKNAKELLTKGRLLTLRAWFELLPEAVVKQSPWLIFWQGMCCIGSNPHQSREILEKAFYLFKEQSDVQGQLISFCSIVDTYIYERAEMLSLDKWIDEVKDLLPNIDDFTSNELGIRVTCAMFIALIYRQPDHPDVELWEERAKQVVLSNVDPRLRLSIGNHLILYYMWWISDKVKAEMIVMALQPILKNKQLPPLAIITWKMIEAGYHWMVTGSGESSKSAQEGLDIGEQHGVHLLDVYILTHAVFSNLCLRDRQEVDKYLAIMTPRIEQHRYMDAAWYYFLYAWNEIAKENYEAALQYAELAMEHADKSGRPFMIANAHIEYATLLYRKGKKDEARALIDKALEIGHGMKSTSIIHLAEFAKVEFEIIEHDEGADLEQIKKCLALAQKAGELSVSWFSPTTLVKFYGLALKHDLEREFVVGRIQKAKLFPFKDAISEESDSLSKFTPPSIERVYERTRLFEKIDQARKDAKVIWVAAPAGSGKTTLVASYIQAKILKPIWFQVDDGDADIASFFYYLGLGIQKLYPKDKPMPLLTPEYQAGVQAFTRNYFRQLFSRLKKNHILVLDNTQDIGESSVFNEILKILGDEVGVNGKVLIISRSQFPKELSRLHVNNQLVQFDWHDLQLTFDECEGIAKVTSTSDDDKQNEDVRTMFEQTQGWVVGFLLAMQNRAKHGATEIKAFTPDKMQQLDYQEYLFDYFSSELFEKLSNDVKSVLLELVYLRTISTTTVSQLVGDKKALDVLESLEKRNHFISRKGMSSDIYEFHPLFRSFLLLQSEKKLTPQETADLMHRTATVSMACGDIENAANLFTKLEKWSDIKSLIETHATQLEQQGRYILLASWLSLLPSDFLENDAQLIYWKGVTTTYVNPFDAYALFEKAFLLFEKDKNWAWCYRSWLGVAETTFLRQDDYSGVAGWMEKLSLLRKESPEYPNDVIKLKITIEAFNLCNLALPEKEEFSYWINETENIYKYSSNPEVRCIAGIRLSLYYAFFAKTDELLSVSQTVGKFTSSNEVRPIVRVMAYWAELTYSWGSGSNNEQEARRLTDAAMKVSTEYGVRGADIWVYSAAIFNALVFADLNTAEEFLEKYSALGVPRQRLYYSNYLFLKGWHELATGDIKPALKHLKEAKSFSSEINVASFDLLNADALVKAYILNDEYDAAKTLLNEIKSQSSELHNDHYYVFKLSMNLAWINLRENKLDEVKSELEKCFRFGREEKCIAGGAWLHAMLAELCSFALQTGIEVDYAKKLISTYKLSPDESLKNAGEWPYSIKIYTLGRFSLVKEGEPIHSGKRAPKKALEILKAIIAFGGRDVNAQKLSSELWPDQDGDAGMNAFTTTLHRLRKFIGTDVVHFENGRLTLNPDLCWVDVWGFESELNRVNAEQAMSVDDDKLAQIDSLISAYQGPFLSSEDEVPWHLGTRERLQQKLTSLIVKVCQALEASQQFECASKYYQHGINVDELNERFYQGQMRCCLEQGLPAEGMSVYQRCVDVLQHCLDVRPSEGTEQLKAQLEAI